MTSGELGARDALERLLARLEAASDAADVLGIPTERARLAHAEALSRLGFPSDVYVLALVGGTGVGKSSLLNAIAGAPVSPVSPIRPTTARPVAWLPRAARTDLDGLLAWLGVTDVHEHDQMSSRAVAILDLPDMDSLAMDHRVVVEQLLPKVDAVAWITDPEKYHDAVLYDKFLRAWLVRLDRQVIVINKADRLRAQDVEEVRRDVERDLIGRLRQDGEERLAIPVITVSATSGQTGIGALIEWLKEGIDGKAVVRARVAASVAANGRELARAAGIDPAAPEEPFMSATTRRAATDAVTTEVLRTLDLRGLERQAVAATRAQARRRGTGPMGKLTSLVYNLSGREAQVADPVAFLVRWRDRGSLTPAVESFRMSLAEPLRNAAPAVRPRLATAVEPVAFRRNLEAAVDRAVARHDGTPPASRVWTAIGLLQTVAMLAIAFSAAWTIVWLIARPAVDTADVPILGRIPMPFISLVASMLVGYALAWSLRVHAGWIGRRWAAHLRGQITAAVEDQVATQGLRDFTRLEQARHTLWHASRDTILGFEADAVAFGSPTQGAD